MPAPTGPMMNRGPALLQNAMTRSYSTSLISFASANDTAVLAPSGYPLVMPSTTELTAFAEMLNIFRIVLSNTLHTALIKPVWIKIWFKIKKGRREGTTVLIQRSSPNFAACMVSFGLMMMADTKMISREYSMDFFIKQPPSCHNNKLYSFVFHFLHKLFTRLSL